MKKNSDANNLDVINPSLYWSDKRCYRILSNPQMSCNSINYAEEDFSYQEEDLYQDEGNCELKPDIHVEYLSQGRYRSVIPIPSTYLPYVIGTRGATKHKIENDTHTKLSIPSRGQVGDVVVNGKDQKSVRQAIIKLELLVTQARKRQPCTHFIEFPTNHQSIQERFLEFKREVLEQCSSSRGVDETLFIEPIKLHLTVCVMILADERESKEAVLAFEKCHREIMEDYICGNPMKVDIQGVEYMNDDPAEVDVLYAKVSTSSWSRSLQDMCDAILSKMTKTGVVKKEGDKVKLHITLMNSKYRMRQTEGETKRFTFDARSILEKFKDYRFGEMNLTEIHFSQRKLPSAKILYTPSCKLSLIP